tara:strand:- start:49 stop:198 length:150 start_codon:yes stop_codon:yes gene_type:complete
MIIVLARVLKGVNFVSSFYDSSQYVIYGTSKAGSIAKIAGAKKKEALAK